MSKSKSIVQGEFLDRECFIYQLPSLTSDEYLPWCIELLKQYFNDEMNSIKVVKRVKSYNNWDKHKDFKGIDSMSNRGEEQWVLNLFKNAQKDSMKTELFGVLLDYQVPLKNSRVDKGYGKIDFVSKSVDDSIFYINEVKADYSPESILKPVCEIITYEHQFDKEKMLKDFGLNQDTKIVKRVIIFDNTKAYKELTGKYQKEANEDIKKLINNYNVEVIVIKQNVSYEKVEY